MTKKEQKELIKMVKKESGTNEFLSVSDLIVQLQKHANDIEEILYYEDAYPIVSNWNDFLRNTPLSMDLFIGEGAIFEGFEIKELGSTHKILTLGDNELGMIINESEAKETYFQWLPYWKVASTNLPYKGEVLLAAVSSLQELVYKTKTTKPITLK